jgi:hypothetical protein
MPGDDPQLSAGGSAQAGEQIDGGQTPTALDACNRGLSGAHPAGELSLRQAGTGAQRVDQFGQLTGERGGRVCLGVRGASGT